MAKDSTNIENISVYLEQNSQEDYLDEISAGEKKFINERAKSLKSMGKTQLEIDKQLAADKAQIQEYQAKQEALDKKKSLEKIIKDGATLQQRLDAKKALEDQKELEEKAEKWKKVAGAVSNAMIAGATGLFTQIREVGKEYQGYVENLEVGLLGSKKSYDSVTKTLRKVFSMNVFFSLDTVLKKTAEAVEKGINYNVELRSSLDVMSEKIAKTFDAFDSNLLRIIKVQGEDSTKARLGMESLLLNYLNANFQDSSYLQGLSDQVSGYLFEASSRKDTDKAVEFEYSIQKWLGSMSSVGVSDSTIQALAQGLGYLGSGDISGLSSNSSLQQLMALSATKGGGANSYGDILTNGLEVADVSNILTGFHTLVKEINSSGNMVAVNQYAKLFNLSMSDLTSVLRITDEQIGMISKNMASYGTTLSQVDKELSFGSLKDRTSASQMFDNMKKNMFSAIGLNFADDFAANIAYELADQAANVVDMLDLGVEVHPFGIGASTKIKAGDMIRGGLGITTYLTEFAKNLGAMGSVLSPKLSSLGGVSTLDIFGGQGASQTKSGTTENQASYIGNTDSSAVYSTVNQEAKAKSSEIMNKDLDAEEEKMKKTQKAMEEIGDNVAFIVELLNVSGIRVRALPEKMGGNDSIAIKKDDPFYFGGGY